MQGRKDVADSEQQGRFDSVQFTYLAMSEDYLTMFKVDSFVKHKEQGIQGRVLYSDRSTTTIYDKDCPNDDDFPEESYGEGSALTFKTHELEPIS